MISGDLDPDRLPLIEETWLVFEKICPALALYGVE